jgi:GT2 family glycosyltransferase
MEAAGKVPFNHKTWLKLNQPEAAPSSTVRAASNCGMERVGSPLFAVHLHISDEANDQAIHRTIASLQKQSAPDWKLYITANNNEGLHLLRSVSDPRIRVLTEQFESRADALMTLLSEMDAAYFIPLNNDHTLTPGALEAYSTAIAGTVETLPILYADQDERNAQGVRSNPWFKPQWDMNLFMAQDYLSSACAIPMNSVKRHHLIDPICPDEGVPFSILARLLLKFNDAPPIMHVPYIAVTCPTESWRQHADVRLRIVQALLDGCGQNPAHLHGARAETGPFGTLSICYPPPSCGVSIIVPTKDKVDLLRTCLYGLLNHTNYHDFEIIVVDNESIEPETHEYFREISSDQRVKLIKWPHKYNYSAINNFAASKAEKPYLCLLNNDTEIISDTWLNELMRHAVRPGVGAVGARLLYPDRSIQHAGVVVGMANAAGHAHRALPDGDPGYYAQAYVTHCATAVTAACLVVAKQAFMDVGGLDEIGLKIAYNDIDLCLKLRKAGLANIYEPRAVLIHHESKSRGLDFSPEHIERYMGELRLFQERWRTLDFTDPMHHRALDPASEVYRVALITPS